MKKIAQVIHPHGGHWVGDGFPVRTLFSYDGDAQALRRAVGSPHHHVGTEGNNSSAVSLARATRREHGSTARGERREYA